MEELPPRVQRYVKALYAESESVRELMYALSVSFYTGDNADEAEEEYEAAVKEREEALKVLRDAGW